MKVYVVVMIYSHGSDVCVFDNKQNAKDLFDGLQGMVELYETEINGYAVKKLIERKE